MKHNDNITATGVVDVYLGTEQNRYERHMRHVDNLVVTAGHEWITARMAAATADIMSHVAIGSGTAAAIIANTTLGTELARVVLNDVATILNNTITFEATFPADIPDVTAPATAAITEAGIFNDASAGAMLARVVFPVVNKGELDVMTISWTITIA